MLLRFYIRVINDRITHTWIYLIYLFIMIYVGHVNVHVKISKKSKELLYRYGIKLSLVIYMILEEEVERGILEGYENHQRVFRDNI